MDRTTVRRVAASSVASGAILIARRRGHGRAAAARLRAGPEDAPAEAPSAQPQPDAAAAGRDTPPVTAAALPEGYVGAETCKACHAGPVRGSSPTPRWAASSSSSPATPRRRWACENCHGPGGATRGARGAARAWAGLISFARNDKTPVDKRNQMCLTCHTKGSHHVLEGSGHEARDVACTGCHKVMEDISPPQNQLARPTTSRPAGTCHIDKRAAAHEALAPSVARGQDVVRLLPQPPRVDHPRAPQGALPERHVLQLPRREARAVPVGARARRRSCSELPRPARLQPRQDAQDVPAAALSAMPHRDPTPDAPRTAATPARTSS